MRLLTLTKKDLTVGTASALRTSSQESNAQAVALLADQDNTDEVWIGDSSVAEDSGFPLAPGHAIPQNYGESFVDLSTVYVIVTNASDKLHVFAILV